MIVKITEEQAKVIRETDEDPESLCVRFPHLIPEDIHKIRSLPKEKLHPSWRIR